VLIFLPNGGILYAWDGDSFIQFGIQALGCIVIVAWSIVTSAMIFLPLRIVGLFRANPEVEKEGLDKNADGKSMFPLASQSTMSHLQTNDFGDDDLISSDTGRNRRRQL